MVVFIVTIVIWNCDGKRCYGRQFRISVLIPCITENISKGEICALLSGTTFYFYTTLRWCSRWTDELLLCLVKTLNKGTNAFKWRYWFVSLNPVESRYTIPFLYIDEVKRKAPTWLRSQSHILIRRSATLNFRDGKDRNS